MEFCGTKLRVGCISHSLAFVGCSGDTCKWASHEICGKRDNVCYDKAFILGWTVIEGRTACPECAFKIKQSWTIKNGAWIIKKLKIE